MYSIFINGVCIGKTAQLQRALDMTLNRELMGSKIVIKTEAGRTVYRSNRKGKAQA